MDTRRKKAKKVSRSLLEFEREFFPPSSVERQEPGGMEKQSEGTGIAEEILDGVRKQKTKK